VEGQLWCWGDDTDNQTTIGVESSVPTIIGIPGNPYVEEVAADGHGTCIRDEFGGVQCTGRNTMRLLVDTPNDPTLGWVAVPLPVPARQLSPGSASHRCMIGTDDQVYCWGENGLGQLGDGSTGLPRPDPQPVGGLRP
jgi:hypothetical protein